MAKNEREDKLYSYDPNTDYQALIDSAVEAQDFSSAAKYEQQRNEKIRGEGITQYQPTYNYTQYLPSYGDQMDAIMEQIFNRQPFEYDMDADALYQQYKDRYLSQGQLAMEDAMGKAAQLTGGYGNSYAQSVGQQTFQGYMDGLNDKVPELYALARSRYDAEGNELLNRYSLLADRENTEYNRETAESQQAYSLALSMLQSGIMPSQGVLESSGISQEDAQAIYDAAYSEVEYGGSSGGSGYSGNSGSAEGTGNTGNSGEEMDQAGMTNTSLNPADFGLEAFGPGMSNQGFAELMRQISISSNGDWIADMLEQYVKQMSEDQVRQLLAVLDKKGL